MKKGFIFIGKGGVGKTTCSASLALKLAENGRTLVASLDPAHNLGDVFDTRLSDNPTMLMDGLFAMEVNTDFLTERYLEKTVSKVKNMYSYLKVLNLDRYIDSLKYSPGIEEYSILEGLVELTSLDYDYIVLDMPPTGLTIRVLTLPYTALIWIEKLMDLRREILGRRRTVENITGKMCVVIDGEEIKIPVEEGEDAVMNELKDKKEKMELVKEFLSEKCHIFLVANPEPLSLFEGKRAIDALRNFGLTISGVVINKYVAENETTERLQRIGKSVKVPLFDAHPHGVDMLREIGNILFGAVAHEISEQRDQSR